MFPTCVCLINTRSSLHFSSSSAACHHANPVSWLSLTAQWLDKDFKLYRATFSGQELTGSHTATLICEAFEAMLQRRNITKQVVHVVVRDNACNTARATDDCGVNSLGCMAHTLQRALNRAVLSQRSVSDCTATRRKIGGHLKHSQVASIALEKLQERVQIPKTRLRQDVATRRSSTFYILTSLAPQRQAIAVYAAEYKSPATLNRPPMDAD